MQNHDITWYLIAIAAIAWLLACLACYRDETREARRRELIERCDAQTWNVKN